jgi:hypothetical protein
MEKRDIIILLVALVALVVVAVVVKPIMTGQPPDLSLPAIPGLTPEPEDTVLPTQQAPQATVIRTTSPTPKPTTPPWSGKSTEIGYVSLGSPEETPSFTRFPDETPAPEKMLTYETIKSTWGGITQTISMPFPYWELEYSVDPWETTFVGETESREAGPAGFQYGEIHPRFSIEVRDASDNSLVREIEPTGGLDKELWEEEEENDPRPWRERFYEGTAKRSYYFVIHTHMINSYTMEVKVPERYVGKY